MKNSFQYRIEKMKDVSFCSSIQNDDQHIIEEGGGIQVS